MCVCVFLIPEDVMSMPMQLIKCLEYLFRLLSLRTCWYVSLIGRNRCKVVTEECEHLQVSSHERYGKFGHHQFPEVPFLPRSPSSSWHLFRNSLEEFHGVVEFAKKRKKEGSEEKLDFDRERGADEERDFRVRGNTDTRLSFTEKELREGCVDRSKSQ